MRSEFEYTVFGITAKFPKVWELNERIPRKAERHVNNGTDNSLCFTTKAKEEIYLKKEIYDLMSFIDNIVIPYLENNSYFEIHRTYIYGFYNHNPLFATWETYKDVFEEQNVLIIRALMFSYISGIKIRPNDLCFCGSSKKIKSCKNHEMLNIRIRQISKATVSTDLVRINQFIEMIKSFNNNQITSYSF